MIVRRYVSADLDAVRRIHAEAFRKPDHPGRVAVEVGLLDGLIAAGDVLDALSLVAVREAQPVGHVVCSRASVGPHRVVGLGPIGVLPEHQRTGVGLALMHAVLAAADAIDIPLVGLLGSAEYYPRFGFVPSVHLRIDPPDPAWGEYFQVRTLARYHAGIVGSFRYAPAFYAA